MSDWLIPLSDLNYGPEEEAAAVSVLRSGWLSMGPEVQAFEQEFAAFLGVKHAFAVSNGTAALHLAYLALGLGPGDEIIQPAINFVAAANMTVAVGAAPAFADICRLDEPTIDPAEIERLITPRTKAVVVMHYGGYLCRMAEITALCKDHGLALVEDACHAVGARYLNESKRPPHGTMAGAIGDAGCFSFFSNKNLGTGEGGMVVTNRDDVADALRLLRSHGMSTLTWDRHKGHASTYDVKLHGYNYRTDEMHAAIGRVQLRKLPAGNEARACLVQRYAQRLKSVPTLTMPFASYCGESARHLMTILASDSETRSKITASLAKARIQTSLHYPCIPQFSAFVGGPVTQVEKSDQFASRVITLPLYPTMTHAQVDEICDRIECVS